MTRNKALVIACVVFTSMLMLVTFSSCAAQNAGNEASSPQPAPSTSTSQSSSSSSEQPSVPQSTSVSTEEASESEDAMEALQAAFSDFMECDASNVHKLVDSHTLKVAKKYGATKEDVAQAISMTFEGDVPAVNDDTGEYSVKITCVPVNEVISHYVDSVYNKTGEYDDLADALMDAEPVEQNATFTLVKSASGSWTVEDGSSITEALAKLCLGSLPSDWAAY